MKTIRFFPSSYYPGGKWKGFVNNKYFDWFQCEWEALKWLNK